MKRLLLSAVLLLSACESGAVSPVPFQPASASATLNELRSQIYVYATELQANVLGYDHQPRSVYLTMKMDSAEKLAAGVSLEETSLDRLSAGHATLRVFEHAQQPRVYIVDHGTVRATLSQAQGTLGHYTIQIDAVLVDPVDGSARIGLNVSFDAPVGAIS